MIYKTRWDFGELKAGTAGTISFSQMSPTIQNSYELTPINALFTEIKCLKATFIFSPKAMTSNTGAAVLQGRLAVGTQMAWNYNVHTNPSSMQDVSNLPKLRYISTQAVRPVSVPMVMPQLEFSDVLGDAPNPVTPYAGSPGVLVGWADNLTASQSYFDVDFVGIYWLRGRK